jgi:glyoxylase-like metal-dependent hydrolase (beta-lactamase superfamily II)
MTELVRINRRLFLARLGKGTLAMAVLGACGDDGGVITATSGVSSTTAATSTTASPTTATTAAGDLARYLRVNLGFVSAYIVIRGSEAAVVDTGVSGSEGQIEAALGTADLTWAEVGHLILTHHHPDHAGSMPAVMTAAAAATGYIGEADLDNVDAPRELIALKGGDSVFGLQVIHTPGHTAGHISLFDPSAGVLVAGDAINGASGGVVGPNPDFSEDHTQALATVADLVSYDFETIYFGHGEPVMSGGSALVTQLLRDY